MKYVTSYIAAAGGMLLGSLPLFSQSHDLDFKIRELTNGTGPNVSGVKIELDDGKYIGYTDANGVAHIHDVVDGTHRIRVAKQGYIEFLQEGYTLSSDQNFNASIIKKQQDGPWGSVPFNVSWWRQTFKNVGLTMRNKDPAKWDHILPVYNRISPTPAYTYADSVNIVAAINEIMTKTGCSNAIQLVSNSVTPDTTYTLYTHSTNTSAVSIDANNIITFGYSKFSVSTPTKRVIHEILQQFDMWSIYTTSYVSVMEPNIAIMADMQPWDANNLAITMYEHYAKKRGEQDLFLGNMMEYVTPTTPPATTVTSPTDESTGLDKLVRMIWNSVSGTGKYHLDVATDNSFANIVKDLLVYRNDTTILLSDDQQYYIRVRSENTAGNSDWSTIVGFHTSFPTSVSEINHSNFTFVYPNPFNEYITISSPELLGPNVNVEIYTTDSKLLKSFTTVLNSNIDLSDLKSGTYLIRIKPENKSSKPVSLTIIKK